MRERVGNFSGCGYCHCYVVQVNKWSRALLARTCLLKRERTIIESESYRGRYARIESKSAAIK